MNSCCNGIADISLPTPSCAVEEKQHSLIIPDRVHHSVKYMLLLSIKGLVACICQLRHCLCIICQLVLKDSVAMQNVPLLLRSGHRRKVELERLAGFYEDLVEKVKAIIKDVFISRIQMTSCNEPGTQVIAYVDLELIPKLIWVIGITPEKDDGEKVMKLMTCLHQGSLLKALLPLAVIFQNKRPLAGHAA